MRTFKHFNQSGPEVCPICGTNDDKEIILVPIAGTEEGNNMQAIQVHADCLLDNLVYDQSIIYAIANN